MPAGDPRKHAPRVKLTYDDFLLFPDDGKRHELIDGEHHVTPSPATKHQQIAMTLSIELGGFVRARGLGELFAAPFDVVFSDFDIVEPDLLFIAQNRREEVLTATHVRGAPDLVIEIGSPATRRRDEREKLRLYERGGVQEYWFVDADAHRVRVYRRAGERFARAVELSRESNDVIASSRFPGLKLPLDRIFSE